MSTFTKMPNDLLDNMAELKPAAFKLVMGLCRLTFGFHRNSVEISYRELAEKTGLSVNGIRKAEADISHIFRAETEGGKTVWVYHSVLHPVAQSDTEVCHTVIQPVAQSDTDYSGLKKLLNKDERNLKESGAGVGFPDVVKSYENEISMITPMASQKLQDAFDEFGGQWVIDAIGEAVKQNVRKWAYIAAILRRWKNEGRGDVKRNEVAIAVDGGFYG